MVSTNSMLLLDQKTMQIKYRIPASEIYRMSLSPYFDDIAVIHIRAVSDPQFPPFPQVETVHHPAHTKPLNK